jgi:hypothetical protein
LTNKQEEERRQKAWAEFYAKQAAEEEERKRQVAWTEYSQRMAAEEALRLQQQQQLQQQLQQQQLQQQQLQQQQLQQQQMAAAMMTVTHTTFRPPPVVFAPAPVFVTQTVVQPVMVRYRLWAASCVVATVLGEKSPKTKKPLLR